MLLALLLRGGHEEGVDLADGNVGERARQASQPGRAGQLGATYQDKPGDTQAGMQSAGGGDGGGVRVAVEAG